MKKNFKQQGFTLIELLVVIAIIGILSSIVLAALGSARQRARETAAQATLSQVRAQAELEGDFTNVCSSGETWDLILEAFDEVNATPAPDDCDSDATSYAVILPQNSQGAQFCVDGTGFAGESTGISTSAPFECN